MAALEESPVLVDRLFSDVNRLTNLLTNLTDSYRLLVGAAEELGRIPGAGAATVNRAIDRADNLGTLIDFVILALALKLDFVLDVEMATPLPLELVVALVLKALQTPRDPANLLPGPPRRRLAEVAEELETEAEDGLETEIDEEITDVVGHPGGWQGGCRTRQKWERRQQQRDRRQERWKARQVRVRSRLSRWNGLR